MGGVGAAYHVNQAMASGQVKRPVSMREAKEMSTSNLSPESVQALQMAKENIESAQTQPQQPEEEPEKPPRKSVAEETKEEVEQVIEREFGPDLPFDISGITDVRQTMMSKERRDEIESRLKPLDIGDMIMKREIQQEIPIIPGKLVITLRTFNQRENIWVLKYLYDFPGSQAYMAVWSADWWPSTASSSRTTVRTSGQRMRK